MLLGNEVGGNIDMPCDGNIVGETFLCEKVCIAQRREKNRNISQLSLDLQTYLVNLFVEW